MPPGSATKTSARSAIICLRSCMVVHDVQLAQAGVADLARISDCGITPTTRAPAASVASATSPISPALPPP